MRELYIFNKNDGQYYTARSLGEDTLLVFSRIKQEEKIESVTATIDIEVTEGSDIIFFNDEGCIALNESANEKYSSIFFKEIPGKKELIWMKKLSKYLTDPDLEDNILSMILIKVNIEGRKYFKKILVSSRKSDGVVITTFYQIDSNDTGDKSPYNSTYKYSLSNNFVFIDIHDRSNCKNVYCLWEERVQYIFLRRDGDEVITPIFTTTTQGYDIEELVMLVDELPKPEIILFLEKIKIFLNISDDFFFRYHFKLNRKIFCLLVNESTHEFYFSCYDFDDDIVYFSELENTTTVFNFYMSGIFIGDGELVLRNDRMPPFYSELDLSLYLNKFLLTLELKKIEDVSTHFEINSLCELLFRAVIAENTRLLYRKMTQH